MNYTPDMRLGNYNKYLHLAESRDDFYIEYITVLNMDNQYQKAYEEIMLHEFQTWESAESKITTQFKIALTELSKDVISKKDYILAKSLLRNTFAPYGSVIEFPKEDKSNFYIVASENEKPWRLVVFRYNNSEIKTIEFHPTFMESFESFRVSRFGK